MNDPNPQVPPLQPEPLPLDLPMNPPQPIDPPDPTPGPLPPVPPGPMPDPPPDPFPPDPGVDPKKWNREKGDTLKKGRHENGTNESKVR